MGVVRECPPYAQAKGMKGEERVVERWESSENAHLCPCNRYERWGKGGQKVGIVRERPPFAQATGMKGGKRMDKRWEKHVNPQPCQSI